MYSDIHKKLYDASSDGAETRVRELLAAGADPNKYKDSFGNTAVTTLIQAGADLNIQTFDRETALAINGWLR